MTKGRLEAFSDGVIAIIITIMVLELQVPHGTELRDLRPLAPVFLSYVLSFVYVGIYWNNHHHLLHAVRHVDGRILWANLHLLFWLSLFPFVTHWTGETSFAAWPVAVYGGVLLMAALAYTVLVRALLARHGSDSVLATGDRERLQGQRLARLLRPRHPASRSWSAAGSASPCTPPSPSSGWCRTCASSGRSPNGRNSRDEPGSLRISRIAGAAGCARRDMVAPLVSGSSMRGVPFGTRRCVMVHRVAVRALACAVVLAWAGAASAQTWTPEQQELWKFEELQWQMSKDKDPSWIEKMVHPSLSYWETGAPSAAEPGFSLTLEPLHQRQQLPCSSRRFFPISITITGNIAVVQYRYQIAREDYKKERETVWGRYTDVLVKEGGRWLFIAWTGGDDPKK